MPSVSASRKALVSASVPAVTRSQPASPRSRTSTPRSSNACQVVALVAELAEEHEVGVRLDDLEIQGADLGDQPVALLLTSSTVAEQLVGVRQRGERGGLGQHRQVVGQPHQLQRVDDRRVGGEIAEPRRGERERLGHRAGHDQPRRGRAAGRPPTAGARTPRRPRRRRRDRGAASYTASIDTGVERGTASGCWASR